MFVRRARGWALNFGNPRALMYAGYLMIGVILGAVSARAATPDPYSLAGVTDRGTFVRYVLGQDQGAITFDWKPDGSFENHLKTRITRDIRILPDAQGRWKEIEQAGSRDYEAREARFPDALSNVPRESADCVRQGSCRRSG